MRVASRGDARNASKFCENVRSVRSVRSTDPNGTRRENSDTQKPNLVTRDTYSSERRTRSCWTYGCNTHVAAECVRRPNVVKRRQNENLRGSAVPKAEGI